VDEYAVLGLSNLTEIAEQTGIEYHTLRHLYGAALSRNNQYVVFRLNDAAWTGIELPYDVSMEWVMRHITRLEE
jgi:hypothetical protein